MEDPVGGEEVELDPEAEGKIGDGGGFGRSEPGGGVSRGVGDRIIDEHSCTIFTVL